MAKMPGEVKKMLKYTKKDDLFLNDTTEFIKEKFEELESILYQKIKNKEYDRVLELYPEFSRVKSFYKKSFIYNLYDDDNNYYEVLVSYNTIIFIKDNNNYLLYDSLKYSNTTTRHIKEYLKQLNYSIRLDDNITKIEKVIDFSNYRKITIDKMNKYYKTTIEYYQLKNLTFYHYLNPNLLSNFDCKYDLFNDIVETYRKCLDILKVNYTFSDYTIKNNYMILEFC